MKYILYVFLGACSYGVLSTIVKISYAHGYSLGEVVGTQMLWGTLITWMIAMIVRKRALTQKPAKVHEKGVTLRIQASPREKLQLLVVGAFTVVTGLLYYG